MSHDFVKGMRRPGNNLFANSIVVLDARTGVYRRHFSLVPEDFHDWDVSGAPTLVRTRGGRSLMAATPKNGILAPPCGAAVPLCTPARSSTACSCRQSAASAQIA